MVIYLTYFIFLSERNTIYYDLLKKEEGFLFYKITGVVPDYYKSFFSIQEIEKINNKKLIKVIQINISGEIAWIYLISDKRNKIIKAPSLNYIDGKYKEMDISWREAIPYYIDIQNFNCYINEKNIKSKETQQEVFLKLLTNMDSSLSYYKFNSVADINTLLKKKPIHNIEFVKNLGFKIIDKNLLEELILENRNLYWLDNKGVVIFDFEFNENQLISVKSEYIGCLGNESI